MHRKRLLIQTLVVGMLCIVLFCAGTVFAAGHGDQCVFHAQIPLSMGDQDDIFDRIIKFFYRIIQAMISLFCKIISILGFRCG